VSALYTGFRAAWLAVEAAGDAALRETLLRALSWYCDENAWQSPAESVRQIVHSGAVSKEQALELAAEMRALTGGAARATRAGARGRQEPLPDPPPRRHRLRSREPLRRATRCGCARS